MNEILQNESQATIHSIPFVSKRTEKSRGKKSPLATVRLHANLSIDVTPDSARVIDESMHSPTITVTRYN